MIFTVAFVPVCVCAELTECSSVFLDAQKAKARTKKLELLAMDLGQAGMLSSEKSSYYEAEIGVLLLSQVLSSQNSCLTVATLNGQLRGADKQRKKYVDDLTANSFGMCYRTLIFVIDRLNDSIKVSSDKKVRSILIETHDFTQTIASDLMVCKDF